MAIPDIIEAPSLPSLYHIGPPLSQGALPAVFYFSLSGSESLTLDPYNQPAIFLSKHSLRVFSLTLPGHEGVHPHPGAISAWNQEIESGVDFISAFVSTCSRAIDFLINRGLVDARYLAAAGLSRGAFVATHLAAKDSRIKTVLGFAPLTKLATLPEFQSTIDYPLHHQLDLLNFVEQLAGKTVRYHVGNRDTCIGTADCFNFIHKLTEVAYTHHHRSPPIELIIYPSVGHKGHGTPPYIFQAGADWLAERLNIFAD